MQNIDRNNDNVITPDELHVAHSIATLKSNEERFKFSKKLALWAFLFMVFMTILPFTPFVSVAKITVLQEVMIWVHISCGGIIATFLGVTGWTEVTSPRAAPNVTLQTKNPYTNQ